MGIVKDNLNKGVEAISNFLIAEIIYHKSRKMDLYKKMGVHLITLFEKYKLSRKNFIGLKLPETLKGYDLNKKPKRIRTSQEK